MYDLCIYMSVSLPLCSNINLLGKRISNKCWKEKKGFDLKLGTNCLCNSIRGCCPQGGTPLNDDILLEFRFLGFISFALPVKVL